MTDRAAVPSLSCVTEADWRFLLPAGPFEHLVVLGGPAELPDALLNLQVATRISSSTQNAASADAVILLAGAAESLDAAARLVQPGGVLYWEVDRRTRDQWAITPGGAARRMRRLGLTPAGTYWVKPGFDNRQMYLPLGALGPFRWYLDTLYRSRTRARQVVNAVLRALSLHRGGLTTFAPCFAVTAIRGASRSIALIERARQEGVPVSEDAVPVLLGQGPSQWNRTVLAVFHPDAGSPTMVIKVPRLAAFNDQIEWEHNTIRELRSRLGPSMRDSIPTSRLFRWNDLAVAAETCVPGASLYSRTGPAASNSLEDLRLTAAWLSAFHRETILESVPAREWLGQRLIHTLCAEYAAAFDLTKPESHLFTVLARQLEAVGAARLPIVWQHADFCPPNVYLDGRKVSVIDWETARHGPALSDLLVLITYWAAMVGGRISDAGRLVDFKELFFGAPTALSQAVRREIADYMRNIGVPSSLFPFLLVYTFIEKALAHPRRLAQFARGHAANRAENLEVGYVGLLAQHVESLFEGEVFRAA